MKTYKPIVHVRSRLLLSILSIYIYIKVLRIELNK